MTEQESYGLRCPYCSFHVSKTKIRETEDSPKKSIRRRRQCPSCKEILTTYEVVETRLVYVTKRHSKDRERFDQEKLKGSIVKAVAKDKIHTNDITTIAEKITRWVQSRGEDEVSSQDIGYFVLRELAANESLHIAFLRFASVFLYESNRLLFDRFVGFAASELRKELHLVLNDGV